MSIRIQTTAAGTLKVGEPTVLQGDSPDKRFSAVFEDDGDTGYFYALDHREGGNPIRDALHIYNSAAVTDSAHPSSIKVSWAENCEAVVLLINDYPHAVFCFSGRQGWCRSGFPPCAVGEEWSIQGHDWDEAALELFQ